MKNLITITLAVCLLLTGGCGTLFQGAVTVTQVRDETMKELAVLWQKGLINQQTDIKIAQSDAAYRTAAATARDALVAYKAGGSEDKYIAALNAVKVAVSGLIDIITPLVMTEDSAKLKTDLTKAKTL